DEDGYVTFVARKKNVIKVSGYSVFPSEIENIAMRVESIKKASAIGVPCDKRGHKVILFYESYINNDSIKENLIAECKKHLEPCAVPAEYIYIDEIPLTNLNKTNVIALEKLYQTLKASI
ncbi:MAG: acyl--CoA ligase, partial [Christensenellaceae bacterium]|nr:acyl--CoA ligase [Christensenellaceae bacterium]